MSKELTFSAPVELTDSEIDAVTGGDAGVGIDTALSGPGQGSPQFPFPAPGVTFVYPGFGQRTASGAAPG